ncbi:MAG: hypothetical protein KDH09_10710 [Chrysiogenetes bacterium]|nr:hypothetical protein [Chrysiogenetes bacterium]
MTEAEQHEETQTAEAAEPEEAATPQSAPEASSDENAPEETALPEWAEYRFEVERALTVPDKGVMVVGTFEGAAPRVKADVRFTPQGAEKPLTCQLLGVANKLFDDDGSVLEGKIGLVLQHPERKDLRPPMQVFGVAGSAPAAETAEEQSADNAEDNTDS